MDISQSDVDQINLILDGKASAEGHFLAYCPQNPMIYGADGPQRIYLDLLLTARGVAQAPDVSTMPKADHPFISNYYLDWNVMGKIDDKGLWRKKGALGPDKDSLQFQREIARRDFSKGVEGSRMAIGPVDAKSLAKSPAFAQKLVKGIQKDNPALKPSVDQIGSGAFDDQIKNFAVRRACKFLIYDAMRNGRKIAYVLDDLDLTEVVAKKARLLDPGGTRRKVPVCTSEIREIFRRWDLLKNHVVFFRWFRKAPSPWDCDYFDPHAYRNWGGYASERAAKLAKVLGPRHPRHAQLLGVVTTYDEGGYSNAIDQFHACQPSSLGPLPSAVWDS